MHDSYLILTQLQSLFKAGLCNTRLEISVVYHSQQVCFFYNSYPRHRVAHSWPLHTLDSPQLAEIETVLLAIRKHYQLTIRLINFTATTWPLSGLPLTRFYP